MIQFFTILSPITRCGVWLCLVYVLMGSIANGQVTVEEMPDNPGRIYRMTITPAAEPSPIFKYRFCVPPRETIAANAATSYLRSFGEGSLSRPLDAAIEEYGHDDMGEWWTLNDGVPIEGLLETPAKKVSQTFDGYIKGFIERATRCRYCDWGLAEEDLSGPEVIEFLLPSVQQTRSISRVLALQTRIAIAEKRFDRAAELMRMNYQLGSSVGKMKFLVCSLVGLAEVGITNDTMIDMIATPGSPNMYYALSELPRPMVDLRESFRMEMSFVEAFLSELFDTAKADLGLAGWREKMSRISNQISGGYVSVQSNIANVPFDGEGVAEGLADIQPDPSVEQLAFRMAPTVVGIFAYGPAKQQLIDGGADAKEVEVMPVAKVVTVAACQSIRSRENRSERWLYQPYDVALRGFQQEEVAMEAVQRLNPLAQPGKIIASYLLASGHQVFQAQARVQRDIDALRVIEAIRMHVAKTGSLPASLDEIKVVPVPVNPVNSKPFSYQLKAGTATLDLPESDGIDTVYRFELRL